MSGLEQTVLSFMHTVSQILNLVSFRLTTFILNYIMIFTGTISQWKQNEAFNGTRQPSFFLLSSTLQAQFKASKLISLLIPIIASFSHHSAQIKWFDVCNIRSQAKVNFTCFKFLKKASLHLIACKSLHIWKNLGVVLNLIAYSLVPWWMNRTSLI